MLSIENTLIEPIALPNDRFKAVRLSFTKNNPNPKKIQYQPSNFPLSCPTALSVWLFSFAFCKMRKVNQSCRIKFFLFFHSLSLSLLIGLRAGVPPPRRGKTDFHRHSSTNRAPSLPRNHSARTSQLYQVSPFNRNTQPETAAAVELHWKESLEGEPVWKSKSFSGSWKEAAPIKVVCLRLHYCEREKVSLERFTAYHTQNAKRWHTHTHTAPENFPSEIVPFEGEGEGKLTVFDKSNLGKMWSGERGGGEAQKTPTFCALLNENNHNVVYGTTPDGKS